MKQRAEQSKTNPPYLYMSIHMLNVFICEELKEEREKSEKKAKKTK